ncbi:uncharacterized protein LOC133326592, partial [Musca vetustissima]|uniref:uncharacterized protein LOC133326592 n=1 Tax=Musca vetustissima TaxID=27455 RepID=UPI002AB77309
HLNLIKSNESFEYAAKEARIVDSKKKHGSRREKSYNNKGPECRMRSILTANVKCRYFGLRQLDLTLLSQLWALNDSIQEFRTMIQENEQEDDETYSTHSRSPSPYDSVSSDGDDEISALKGKKLLDMQNANNNASVITTQPKLTPKSYGSENETTTKQLANNRQSTTSSMGSSVGGGVGSDMATFSDQRSHLMKPPLPKPLDVKPVPRMRSAPPPPPTHRKSQNAPPRPT